MKPRLQWDAGAPPVPHPLRRHQDVLHNITMHLCATTGSNPSMKPSELKFNEIKKYLTDYFSPTPLEMSERHRFTIVIEDSPNQQRMLTMKDLTVTKALQEAVSYSIGKLNGIKATLNLKENIQPKFLRARQVPYALKEKVFAELDRLESEGILTKVNVSEWATPIVPGVKPNGTVSICGDFKSTINQHLAVDQYPLPLVEDVFAKLSGGQKYTKIDLRQAFLQMEVDQKSKHLRTINTEKGLFRYNRMVFGIAPAPAIWQRTIEQVLQGVPMTHATQDDILVSGTTEEDHLENLSKVLKRLESFGLKANL
ncbi:uncharacterized protein K02A2.6-like [Ornithodoros turicata]|uniref:uncharacterized protein K02A2.6-like n=1 Tax=Ornithodoros turicata TaxID=34597 RepID=UPI0031391319